jgi:hypothetical protein
MQFSVNGAPVILTPPSGLVESHGPYALLRDLVKGKFLYKLDLGNQRGAHGYDANHRIA